MLFILLYVWLPDFSFTQDDLTLTNQILSDSVVAIASEKDGLVRYSVYKIDSNHRSRSIHPYFQDSYQIIQDMRRLVRMFNYSAIEGYESMSDRVAICRRFPEQKQTRLIFTAMAGGAVNTMN